MSEDAAAAHLEKARSKLRAAQVLLDAGEAEDCVSRAYYAIYHRATAALRSAGEAPKTHRGTQTRFWLRFVRVAGAGLVETDG